MDNNQNVYDKSLPGHADIPNNEEKPQTAGGFNLKDIILEHRYEIKELINRDLNPVQRFLAKRFIAAIVPKEDRGAVFGFLGDDGQEREEYRRKRKDLDDDYEPNDYVPDPEINDEIRAFATSRFMDGVRWGEICDEILIKYDVEYHPMTLREIVQRALIWKEKVKNNPGESKELNEANLKIAKLEAQISQGSSYVKMGLAAGVIGILSFVLGKFF